MYYVEYAINHGEDELGNPLVLIHREWVGKSSILEIITKHEVYRLKYYDQAAQV